MNKLYDKLGITNRTMKRVSKEKSFNKVKDNIPLVANYNMMCDLLFLPTAKFGFKYLFVIVDLANDKFDIEPMKNKDANTVLSAMKKCFKRGIITKPEYTLKSDSGSEFQGVFHKYLYDESILHKVGLPNRHNSLSNVESLNRQLSRLINTLCVAKETETGKPFNNWTQFVPIVREELNIFREKTLPKNVNDHVYEVPVLNKRKPKFKIGDLVHRYLDWPVDSQGKKQPTAQRREGDINYDRVAREIIDIFVYAGTPTFRYYLEGLPNVSFTDHQLIKSR
jgi:hypothetical protein